MDEIDVGMRLLAVDRQALQGKTLQYASDALSAAETGKKDHVMLRVMAT
jgi:hypothetical protein